MMQKDNKFSAYGNKYTYSRTDNTSAVKTVDKENDGSPKKSKVSFISLFVIFVGIALGFYLFKLVVIPPPPPPPQDQWYKIPLSWDNVRLNFPVKKDMIQIKGYNYNLVMLQSRG